MIKVFYLPNRGKWDAKEELLEVDAGVGTTTNYKQLKDLLVKEVNEKFPCEDCDVRLWKAEGKKYPISTLIETVDYKWRNEFQQKIEAVPLINLVDKKTKLAADHKKKV